MPPSNHFEKLRGNLEGWHSIRVNQQRRLIFRRDGGKGEASTAATALMLARVFGNSPDLWPNTRRRGELWEAMHNPAQLERIERAKPLKDAA